MFLLEILIVLFAQLTAMFGMVGAIVVVCLGSAAAALLACYLTNMLVNAVTGFGGGGYSRVKEKQKQAKAAKFSRKAKKLAQMGNDALKRWCEKNSNDMDALRELCGRCQQKGDIEGYVCSRERLLELDPEMDVPQRAAYSHQLADLCLNLLHDQARARRILEQFVARFPQSEEASHTRKRLERIADAGL